MTIKLVKTAFERLVDQFKAAGQGFDISTRPYYSSGAFKFDVVASSIDSVGLTRLFLRAVKNQRIEFFSYGLGDDVDSVGLGDRNATDCDTNIVEKTNTNNEDMCIEGISATARGVTLQYDPLTVVGLPKEWTSALTFGSNTIEDISSSITPPEASSPLALEDALFRAIAPKTMCRVEWNRKEGDYLGTVDEFPEGGGKSYLRSNGEPSFSNYFRVPEGWLWRREGAPRDTILVVSATLCEDVLAVVTAPFAFIEEVEDPPDPSTVQVANLQALSLVWKLRMHGRAIYLPSQNV